MDSNTARGVVIGTISATAIIASLADLTGGHPPNIRVAVGSALAAAMLYALADPAPPLAAALGGLVLLTTTYTNYPQISAAVKSATS